MVARFILISASYGEIQICHFGSIQTCNSSLPTWCLKRQRLSLKPCFQHLAQLRSLLRLEAALRLRNQQMGAARQKPVRNVINGKPGRIQWAVLPDPLSALPFAMMLQ
jgi:hypothetical protein